MNASAYLHFDGQCEEAFAFYANAFRAETITLMGWEQMPGGPAPAGM